MREAMTGPKASGSVTPPSSLDIDLFIQNIGGSDSKNRKLRREFITWFLRREGEKSDFISFVDNVHWVDVETFLKCLWKLTSGSKWTHVADKWDKRLSLTKLHTPAEDYNQNLEGLLYNGKIYKRLEKEEDLFRRKDFKKYGYLISHRYRAGVFEHLETRHIVCVVSYHGRRNKKSREEGKVKESTRQKCFQG